MQTNRLATALLILAAAAAALAAPNAEPKAGDKKPAPPPEEITVATVNGETISKALLIQEMIAQYGQKALNGIVARTLVRQEQKRLGIRITRKQIEAFIDRIVKADFDVERLEYKRRYGKNASLEDEYRRYGGQTLAEAMEKAKNIHRKQRDRLEVELVLKRIFHYHDMTLERVRVRHILVDTRKKAEKLLVRLREGANFSIVAKRESVDLLSRSQGGAMPAFVREDCQIRAGYFDKTFQEAAFRLKVGELSEVIRTKAGFHIIKKIEHIPPSKATYAELSEKIEAQLKGRDITANERNLCFERLRIRAKITRTLHGSTTHDDNDGS